MDSGPRSVRARTHLLRKRAFVGKGRPATFPGAPAPPCVSHTPDDDHDEGTASVVYNEWNVQTFGSLGAWEPGLLVARVLERPDVEAVGRLDG